jgi:ubiquitin carboxyl-terminal hydrolase 10
LIEQEEDIQSEQGQTAISEATDIATPAVPRPETPSTTQPPSEEAPSTTPTTPSSVQTTSHLPPTSTTPGSAKAPPRAIALPVIPALPKTLSKPSPTISETKQESFKETAIESKAEVPSEVTASAEKAEVEEAKQAPVAAGPPKSWANLFKGSVQTGARSEGVHSSSSTAITTGFAKTNAESLSDALFSFSASAKDAKIAFLEPRGLVNTGNMCYMNSVSRQFRLYLRNV